MQGMRVSGVQLGLTCVVLPLLHLVFSFPLCGPRRSHTSSKIPFFSSALQVISPPHPIPTQGKQLEAEPSRGLKAWAPRCGWPFVPRRQSEGSHFAWAHKVPSGSP